MLPAKAYTQLADHLINSQLLWMTIAVDWDIKHRFNQLLPASLSDISGNKVSSSILSQIGPSALKLPALEHQKFETERLAGQSLSNLM